jgi:hypothetical protein
MRTKRCLASALGVGLVVSSAAFGQAIVEYGHGVAKAGVAGAASGTGLAGIFSKMKDSSDDKDKNRQYTTAKTPAETAAVAAETQSDSAEPGNAPGKMTTSSGVVISGVSPSWISAAYSDPMRKTVRVKDVEWSNAAEEQAAAASQAASEPQPVVVEQAAATAEAGSPVVASPRSGTVAAAPVVGYNSGYSSFAPPANATGPRVEGNDAEVAGVRIGSKIDEVVRTLGRPSFTFTGIVGKNYTEKYVFKNSDGETITVMAWTGIVTSVLLN